jgi:hypothetical protein
VKESEGGSLREIILTLIIYCRKHNKHVRDFIKKCLLNRYSYGTKKQLTLFQETDNECCFLHNDVLQIDVIKSQYKIVESKCPFQKLITLYMTFQFVYHTEHIILSTRKTSWRMIYKETR